eukprot:7376409-Prymnesium_polylepis.9
MPLQAKFVFLTSYLEFTEKTNRPRERLCVEHPSTQRQGASLKFRVLCLVQRVEAAGNEEHGK